MGNNNNNNNCYCKYNYNKDKKKKKKNEKQCNNYLNLTSYPYYANALHSRLVFFKSGGKIRLTFFSLSCLPLLLRYNQRFQHYRLSDV